MTVSKCFQGLPDDALILIIRCYDNRTIWSTLSKKLRTLWRKAGMHAVNDRLNPLPRKLIAGQPITLDNVDLLLQQARTHLSIQQTILMPARQMDLNPIFFYRNIPRINDLQQQIDAAQKNHLESFDKWFAERSEHVKNTPQDGNPLIPGTQNFILIDRAFGLLADNSFAVPLELLDLNLPPTLFAKALIHSAKHHQIPFVKALVARNEVASQIPAESWNRALESACIYNYQAPPPLRCYDGLLKIIESILPYSSRDYGCMEKCFHAVLKAPSMTLENRLASLSLFLEDPRGELSILIDYALWNIVTNRVVVPPQALMDVIRLLLRDVRTDETIYRRTQDRLKESRQSCRLPQNTFNQIQIALFEHPLFSIPFFTEQLWNANKERSEEEFLTLLRVILDHPTTHGSRLWKYFASAIGPYQSYDTYRTALRKVASHPHAAQMPLVVRLMIAFERAWAFITFPIHGALTLLFGWKVSQVITSVLLFPITLLRVLGAAFLNLAVLYSNPSR